MPCRRLNGNDLSGKLPEQWSEMVSLEYLYLNQNKLSGHLSENVFKEMKNMKHL